MIGRLVRPTLGLRPGLGRRPDTRGRPPAGRRPHTAGALVRMNLMLPVETKKMGKD